MVALLAADHRALILATLAPLAPADGSLDAQMGDLDPGPLWQVAALPGRSLPLVALYARRDAIALCLVAAAAKVTRTIGPLSVSDSDRARRLAEMHTAAIEEIATFEKRQRASGGAVVGVLATPVRPLFGPWRDDPRYR